MNGGHMRIRGAGSRSIGDAERSGPRTLRRSGPVDAELRDPGSSIITRGSRCKKRRRMDLATSTIKYRLRQAIAESQAALRDGQLQSRPRELRKI